MHAKMALVKNQQPQDLDMDAIRQTWKTLYATTLPALARAKDPAQPVWPVALDHCFARIILDNTVGSGMQQWDKVIPRPAVKNMSAQQLQAAIELGGKIRNGAVDLVELDRRSLVVRGKSGKYGDGDGGVEEKSAVEKRKRTVEGEGEDEKRRSVAKLSKKDHKEQATLVFTSSDGRAWKQSQLQLPSPLPTPTTKAEEQEDGMKDDRSQLEKELAVTSDLSESQIIETLQKIQRHPTLTPFRRRLYISLLSVPKGQYTTYAALASHLGSAARAVGNGMRNNPFAPDVPCHRVLASDGTLGGYFGDWGREGKYLPRQEAKVRLLGEEGVRFDSTGKVKGPVWKGFWNLGDFEREYGGIS